MPDANPISYKPSAYYFRKALRGTDDSEELRTVGLVLVSELERMKAWIREAGMTPPRWVGTPEESEDKGWRSGS
jgi:hypothetical protein